MTNQSSLPYRPCAGIMLINKDNLIWVGQRLAKPSDGIDQMFWQMPQGGIDPGETPEQAAFRELKEETGVTSTELIAETEGWLTYDLPQELLGIALKGKYRGQKQKWFAMRFIGEEKEINIIPDETEQEFNDWKWVSAKDLPNLTIPFKQDIYHRLLETFQDII